MIQALFVLTMYDMHQRLPGGNRFSVPQRQDALAKSLP